MPQAGRFDQRYIMNKIKMYSTSLTTIEADIFKQIKILAAKLNRDKNNLLEEAAQDLIKKYKHNELRTSNG
jgi:predicted transcriptional regulator